MWLDDVEASPLFGGASPAFAWETTRHLPQPQRPFAACELPLAQELWNSADTALALAWLCLREALAAPRWIRMPDGHVLVQVGGGLAARVHVRRHEAAGPVRGAVGCRVHVEQDRGSSGKWSAKISDIAAPVTTHIAETNGYTSRMSILLPRVWLAGEGHAADVEFVAAPMLMGAASPFTAGAAAGAIAGVEVERRDDERRAESDDDDDY